MRAVIVTKDKPAISTIISEWGKGTVEIDSVTFHESGEWRIEFRTNEHVLELVKQYEFVPGTRYLQVYL